MTAYRTALCVVGNTTLIFLGVFCVAAMIVGFKEMFRD